MDIFWQTINVLLWCLGIGAVLVAYLMLACLIGVCLSINDRKPLPRPWLYRECRGDQFGGERPAAHPEQGKKERENDSHAK